MLRKILKLWGALPLSGRLRWWLVYLGLQKFPVGVAAVPLNERGEILLFRHTYRGRYPWGLPTGWLKPGEKPEEAIVREIQEETGLVAGDIQLILAYTTPGFRKLDLFYRCCIVSGTFRPSAEVSEIGWFSTDELPRMLASQYNMINEIIKKLE